jgi:hypothetical protein
MGACHPKTYLRAGGCAENDWIYKNIGKFTELTAAYKRATVHGGRSAYVHEVCSYIANLKQYGCLKQVSRGRYCLADADKARIAI